MTATSDLRGLHLHLDAPSGAAGDMVLGALFDLGVPEAVVREVLARLPISGFELTATKAKRAGVVGTDVKVTTPANAHAPANAPASAPASAPANHRHDHDHDHDHGMHEDEHEHEHEHDR